MSEPQVEHDAERSRWVARVDGEVVGLADYRRRSGDDGDVVVFPHTEVDPRQQGRGIAGAIVRAALEDLQDEDGTTIVPACSFVRRYVDEHPEFRDLVAG